MKKVRILILPKLVYSYKHHKKCGTFDNKRTKALLAVFGSDFFRRNISEQLSELVRQLFFTEI